MAFDALRRPWAHSGGVSRMAIFSYVFDYVIIVILLVAFLALDLVEPFHQQFSLSNYTLHYTYVTKERVSTGVLVIVAVLAPAVIVAIYTLAIDGLFSHKVAGRKQKHKFLDRLWELNCGILGLGLAISLQYVIVGSLKNAIGKPRPDLLDRCRPLSGSADPLLGLSKSSICTQTDHAILKDGFRSFPSGHSSTSFAGLWYLSLYLAGKLHIMDSRGEVWKMFIVLAPILGAAIVAGTRIMDARHHPFDVISGSFIGILIAWAAYRQYFPAIHNFRAKGRAYPMRTWGIDRTALHPEESTPMQDHEQPNTGMVDERWSSDVPESERHRHQSNRPVAQHPLRQMSNLSGGNSGQALHGSDNQQRMTGDITPRDHELQPGEHQTTKNHYP